MKPSNLATHPTPIRLRLRVLVVADVSKKMRYKGKGENMNYWCYRIDNNAIAFFTKELREGRLRQGWGYDVRQDLLNRSMDGGAKRNLAMLKVKKGDILLVPHLPSWSEVALVEATEDWRSGYRFEIDPKYGDYGHIFPARLLKSFTRFTECVSGNIRQTLKNPSRFWCISHYGNDVKKIVEAEESVLHKKQRHGTRFTDSVESVFNECYLRSEFADKLFKELNTQFSNEEWEFAIVLGLQTLFPNYLVERVGGKLEAEHGTDILIKIPGLLPDYEYAIAIQVKDYKGWVSGNVISQINKADSYWNNEGVKLIEKVVIITGADKIDNQHLQENDSQVKIIFASDLKDLLLSIAESHLGIKRC